MKKILGLIFLSVLAFQALGQKVIVVDKYTAKRQKLYTGDQILFKIKGDKTLYTDEVSSIGDSSFVINGTGEALMLKDISYIYFHRPMMDQLTVGSAFVGAGFLVSGLVQPNGGQFKNEPFFIGASFLAISAVLRLLRWKKYHVADKDVARIQIIDTTFENK